MRIGGHVLRPIKTGYESPCGVMRPGCVHLSQGFGMLRIPMRGYELTLARMSCAGWKLRIPMRGYENYRANSFYIVLNVTNPHAGL